MNNFVVFDGFFPRATEPTKPVETDNRYAHINSCLTSSVYTQPKLHILLNVCY